MYYTDKCSIQNITRSAQFGEETEGTPFTIKCRVEQEDTLSGGGSGSINNFKRLYFLPPRQNVHKGDKIKTTSQRGVTITEEYIEIDEVLNIGGITPHHMEVYIY